MAAPENTSTKSHNTLNEKIASPVTGGLLLVIATIVALVWANSGVSESYFSLKDFTWGFGDLHIFGITIPGVNMSMGHWASEGLLAVFFFLAGLELKREFVSGELRKFSQAIVPISAAASGVLVPALIYFLINAPVGGDAPRGWAIPAATDIAFAVAILALVGKFLPPALRTFLLTLAVVDDLIAIVIIALFYSHGVSFPFLLGVLIPLGLFALAIRSRWNQWYILLPLAIFTWYCIYQSGIHATIAGVLLGFAVPVRAPKTKFFKKLAQKAENTGNKKLDNVFEKPEQSADILEHKLTPLSTGIAVPLFAFFSAGVYIGGVQGFTAALDSSITLAIIAALFCGKPIGVLGMTFILTKVTKARLDPSIKWVDLLGIGFLTGIGFTVSLLIAELSFAGSHPDFEGYAKIGILLGSLLAATCGSLVLIPRNNYYKKLKEKSS